MKKIFSIIIGAILLLPIVVSASDFTVSLSCPTQVDAGKEFTCTVSTSDPSVTAFQATIDLSEASNLQLNGTKTTESFIGKTGNIFLTSSYASSGIQKIRLTSISDSNSRNANNVETEVTVGTETATPKENPDNSIDGPLVLILVISALAICGYYVFNKNSIFTSI